MNIGNGFVVILLSSSVLNLVRAISDDLMFEPDEDLPKQNQDLTNIIDNEDDDDETLERKRTKYKNTIPYGETCDKKKSFECMLFPDVQCINVVATTYLCRCDFLHTWNATEQKCIMNVLAPCLVGDQIVPCGANMECIKDSLGISDEDRFCRCLKGFKMVENDDKIPAFCVADENYVEEAEEIFIKSAAHAKKFTLFYFWSFVMLFIHEWAS